MKRIIQKFMHDFFGWGYPYKFQRGGDVFQPTYECFYCAGEVAQDSTGAWFHLSN